MSLERISIILIGMLAMILLMLLRRKTYPEVPVWKIVSLGVLLTVAGVVGTMLMYYIENGQFGGTSFFGAVLLVPVLILPALLLRMKYKDILDLCAPAICLMLAVMKVDCIMQNCCIGKYLPSLGFQFPSQIVEMIFALFVMAALLLIEKRTRGEHLYSWFLLLYGVSRLLLNGFRYGIKPFVWIIPNGHFWAGISMMIGIVWILLNKRNIRNLNL